MGERSFSSWWFDFRSHPIYNIFAGSESHRIRIFGKTEGTEMGLKMMVPDETVRKGTEFGGLWSSRGEDWGGMRETHRSKNL